MKNLIPHSAILQVVLTLIFLLSSNLAAQISITSDQFDAWESFNQKFQNNWKVSWSYETGNPQRIYGYKTSKYKDSPEKILKKFLKELKDVYKWNELKDDFTFIKTLEMNDRKIYSYQQIYKGIPVFTGDFYLYTNSNEELTMAFSKFYKNIDINTEPEITADAAKAKALEYYSDYSNLIIGENPSLMIYPFDEKYELAWVLQLDKLPNFSKLVFVGAKDGSIITEKSLLSYSTGLANVYYIDPIYGLSRDVTLNRLDFGTSYLNGDFANVLPTAGQRAESRTRDFRYEPNESHFDEANVYFQVDRIAHVYFSSSLNYNMPERTAYITGPGNMATYNYSTEVLSFATGDSTGEVFPRARNLARKNEVIYHEYSHAVAHRLGLTPGTAESDAKQEGYADYFACSFTGDPIYGEWVWMDEPYHARTVSNSSSTFNYVNWNSVSYYSFGPDPYGRSMIWSGTLWDLRNALGQTIADWIIFYGILNAPGSTNFDAGLDGIILADVDYYGAQHVSTIESIFAARGIGKPGVPTGFSISGNPGQNPVLNWNSNPEPDISGYKIYRSDEGAPYYLLTTVNKYTTSFTDNGVIIGQFLDPQICYKISAYDVNNKESNKTSAQCVFADGMNKGKSDSFSDEHISNFELKSVFPNPFNPSATISFQLPSESIVKIKLFNILGQEIRTIADRVFGKGIHNLEFSSYGISSGTYLLSFGAHDINSKKNYRKFEKIMIAK